jgi:hypothetical protein
MGDRLLGMSVLRSLAVVAEPGMIAVLLRSDSDRALISSKQKQIDELRSLGVSLVTGDLANLSATWLAELLRPYDTVVSCTGFVGGSGTQRRIAQAALLAGVKRFVPWQFGVDYDVIGRGSAQDLFDEQLDVRDLLFLCCLRGGLFGIHFCPLLGSLKNLLDAEEFGSNERDVR